MNCQHNPIRPAPEHARSAVTECLPSKINARTTVTTWVRIAVAVVAGLSLWIGAPGLARADNGDKSKVEFESVNANATLTDCPTSGPAGLHCTGIVINAAENNDSFQNSKFVGVQLFDVELIPGSFVATLIGSGVSATAKLSIKDNLKRASLSAIVDITNCTSDPNVPEPTCTLVRTVDINVKWFGVGEVTRTHFEDSFESGGCEFEFESDFARRSATVTATVDGVDIPNSVLPQFVPSISSSESEQTIECDPPSALDAD